MEELGEILIIIYFMSAEIGLLTLVIWEMLKPSSEENISCGVFVSLVFVPVLNTVAALYCLYCLSVYAFKQLK